MYTPLAAFPTPVTFSPGPLTSITAATEDTKAFRRAGFAGSYPNYTANDWTTAAPSRTPPMVVCPPTQPAFLSSCTATGSCNYGAVTCLCFAGAGTTMSWLCQ